MAIILELKRWIFGYCAAVCGEGDPKFGENVEVVCRPSSSHTKTFSLTRGFGPFCITEGAAEGQISHQLSLKIYVQLIEF